MYTSGGQTALSQNSNFHNSSLCLYNSIGKSSILLYWGDYTYHPRIYVLLFTIKRPRFKSEVE